MYVEAVQLRQSKKLFVCLLWGGLEGGHPALSKQMLSRWVVEVINCLQEG